MYILVKYMVHCAKKKKNGQFGKMITVRRPSRPVYERLKRARRRFRASILIKFIRRIACELIEK